MASEIDRAQLKPAFDYARGVLKSSYIYDEGLRLRCLRADLFNVRKAAWRFLGFLDLLWDTYGDEALTRPIRMSDLNKEETDLIKSGEYQILPFRDRSGRRILTIVGQAGLTSTLRARMKVLTYLFFVIADDVETQRRGIILLYTFNFDNGFIFPHKDEIRAAERVTGFTPTRKVALHQCTRDDLFFRLMHGTVVLQMAPDERIRVKFHKGSPVEVAYKLLCFGIPTELIPLTDTGKVKMKNHNQWLKLRRVKEQRNDVENDLVECPNLNDVVFRVGKSYLTHPGNSFYRGLVEECFQQHNEAPTSDSKVELSWHIIGEVERRGGRFLVWDNANGWWTVLTDRNQIRSKVAISLKEQKKKKNPPLKDNHTFFLPTMTASTRNVTSDISGDTNPYQFERQDGRKRKRDKYGVEARTFSCFLV
jgi:hypothetical protein